MSEADNEIKVPVADDDNEIKVPVADNVNEIQACNWRISLTMFSLL